MSDLGDGIASMTSMNSRRPNSKIDCAVELIFSEDVRSRWRSSDFYQSVRILSESLFDPLGLVEVEKFPYLFQWATNICPALATLTLLG